MLPVAGKFLNFTATGFFMPPTELFSIEPFLNYLKFQKRYSQHTLCAYETDLRDFFEFIEFSYDATPVPELSAPMIRSWLAELKEKKLTSKSINRKISALKSYFKFQLRTGMISISPMATIISLKVNKRLPSYIEEKDMNTLFQHVEFPDTWEGKTDRLLLLIFYHTGIRLSELVNLKTSQIDRSNSNIKVLGKGNKERVIPVNNDLVKQMMNYIEDKLQLEDADNEFLLVNSRGKKLYQRQVYTIVKTYLSLVTTNARKSPHILRHTFATHLTNNGADINAVKELLGHSGLASTQVYTHNSIEKLKDIHRQAHPKS